ncbi:hypothetical protein BRADO1269 [Bradyrhizobium sp. ORS 278]|uniref:gas vesicle protein GvpO n=1 Tax=Bradyrhizobium sp. (strain ORS 278) TaxID=114615 RepID=UPI0001507D23|nr:gas vesicle protein GvpO [Bradyrhizobium sp. ORS 278]CAL75171.1 hypothetical protein BRADO1269 [Bradyrhizobium sp. ORS 278]
MTPIELTKLARTAARDLLEVPVETVSRCCHEGDGWTVEVEVTEQKGKIADNDVIARYLMKFSETGEVMAFERVSRALRSAG